MEEEQDNCGVDEVEVEEQFGESDEVVLATGAGVVVVELVLFIQRFSGWSLSAGSDEKVLLPQLVDVIVCSGLHQEEANRW